MRGAFSELAVLVRIAFRNLFASRLKTLIVGGIVFAGAVLVVVGSSLLDSVNDAMSRSIIGSVAGNVQVYSSKSKDELSIWGTFGGDPDLEALDDFSKVKKTLETVPNVKEVVPMGISGAMVAGGNTIDLVLAKLREAVKRQRTVEASPANAEYIEAEKGHVQQIIQVLEEDHKNLGAISADKQRAEDEQQALATASAPGFWTGFDQDPFAALEFLENKIAPLATDADLLFIRYVGTDTDVFQKSFDRMVIVDGTAIPSGRRGFLFAKFFYEDRLKLRTARRLDLIKQNDVDVKAPIARDPDSLRRIKENQAQTREILLQLDGIKARRMAEKLRAFLKTPEGDKVELAGLLQQFMKMDDSNFTPRYQFFYDELAPMLELYRIRVGDTLTIKAFTKSGYVQSVNVKIYGTFDFKGLEKSALAGSLNIIDIVSFRQLYGFLTADKAAEIAKMKAASGAKELDRGTAEAELFGTAPAAEEPPAPGAKTVEATLTPGIPAGTPEEDKGTVVEKLKREELADRVYSKAEIEDGVVLNAAVILKDPTKLKESMAAIEAAGKRDGLDLKAMSWQQASGLIGQFVWLLSLVLFVAVLIIFAVALVIINNSMVMATLERVQEIGTLRAIGAQQSFIRAMLLVEAGVIGVVFGSLGAAVGAGIVKVMGAVGLRATTDQMYFFFSGPRLYPFLGATSLVAAFVIVLLVSALSSLYPAWLAMRVTPRQAMASEE